MQFAEQHNCIGQSFYQEQKIEIDMGHAPKEFTDQAFCHEVVHYILYVMGEHELRKSEKFVDLFANFMFQFIEYLVPDDELMAQLKGGLTKLRDTAPNDAVECIANNLLEEMEDNGY